MSPIVGGEVLKGPTAAFMALRGPRVQRGGVREHYGELLDGIVADELLDGRAPRAAHADADGRPPSSARASPTRWSSSPRSCATAARLTTRAVRTAAILPVKSFGRAKQRLGAGVADPLRLALARAMVADVLDALAATEGVELTVVVTREPRRHAPPRPAEPG